MHFSPALTLSLYISYLFHSDGAALYFMMSRSEIEESGGLSRRDRDNSSPRGIFDEEREKSHEREREMEREREKEIEKEKSKRAGTRSFLFS